MQILYLCFSLISSYLRVASEANLELKTDYCDQLHYQIKRCRVDYSHQGLWMSSLALLAFSDSIHLISIGIPTVSICG